MALAPELVEELRYVEISVARRIRSLRFGQSRSPLKGSGYEFESHRKYQVGEDVRRIDWNVTARMQEIFIKRHFEEREVSVFLVADVSRSMRFSTAKHSKNLRVMQVGATLLLIGARVGFNPLEFFDFLLGFAGYDIAGDDPDSTAATGD